MPPLADRRRAGGIDLHLKKELTHIRKAARGALKDPGTSYSSRRSPPPPTSSAAEEINGNPLPLSSQLPLLIDNNDSYSNGTAATDNDSGPDAKDEVQVFLCNWRRDRNEPEEVCAKDDVDSSTSVSNGGGYDSRSDGCLSSVYGGSAIFKCRGANVTPSIRHHAIRKKSKRISYSSAGSRRHREKVQMLLSRYRGSTSVVADGSSLGDDTDGYFNSPLLKRLESCSGWAQSPTKSSSTYGKKSGSVSYNYRYSSTRNPSTVESYDATTVSFNNDDDEDDDENGHLDLPGRQKGCGIPCYWSRRSTPKSRSSSCCSPSLSDTLMMRKGSSVFGGSQTRVSSMIPLLRNGADDRNSSLQSDDEHSVNFRELDLEALSRLDKRRSSSCREEVNDEGSPEYMRSLSHKYRPMFFEDLTGQNIVIKALTSAVFKRKVSPLYLFHGPRGVGKTSTARIFASALNCLSIEETKPCGVCGECADFNSGKSRHLVEVDGSNKRGIERVKNIFKKISEVYFEKYKIFVVDECHLLPSRAWHTFLRILEKPLPRVVFILVSSDINSVPRAVLSRCQKHFFNMISNEDIVTRLRMISSEERLDVELSALDLIASNADGSVRDAEIMLDQLSLLGKRITKTLVNELVGMVSNDKLMELLELAMSSNATETVIRARELMDSGVEPLVLMAQLVTLIVDVIAGTCPSVDAKGNKCFVGGRDLTERELERLKHALTVLSEAEKHLRFSCERSTWLTATLLQLGSVPSPDRKTRSISSQRKSLNSTEENSVSIMTREEANQRTDPQFGLEKSAPHNLSGEKMVSNAVDVDSTRTASEMMDDIWIKCIEKCHSKTLRQLLLSCGKLILLSEIKGALVAHVAFEDSNIKTRAEGFLSSIINSFEIVLRCNVEVKLVLLQDSGQNLMYEKPMDRESKTTPSNMTLGSSDLDLRQDSSKLSSGSFNGPIKSMATSTPKDSKSKVPLRRIESIIHEEKLESAWLQAMDRNTPLSMSPSRPERNQVLPQDGIDRLNELEIVDGQLIREIKELKINDGVTNQTDQIVVRTDHRCPISPSLLHKSGIASHVSNDSMGDESGPGAGICSMFCWNNRRRKTKQGTATHEGKSGRFSWFGECAKANHTDNRHGR